MNCAEFQKALPEFAEPQRDTALQAHLRSCSDCSLLVSDLDSIVAAAPSLAASEDPNPQIWLQLEAALKNEGLIRQPAAPLLVPPPQEGRGWRLSWALPVAAAVALTIGLLVYRPSTHQNLQSTGKTAVTESAAAVQTAAATNAGINEDQDLLEVVGTQSPTMRAEYAANLKDVNAYIRDAEDAAKANPDDEQAQESVMNAYEQRSMLYEMAMDRSLP